MGSRAACLEDGESAYCLEAKGERLEAKGEDKKNELDASSSFFIFQPLHFTLLSKELLHGYLILQYVTMLIL